MRFRCRFERADNRLLCILRIPPTVEDLGQLQSQEGAGVSHQIRGSRVKDDHKRLAAYT